MSRYFPGFAVLTEDGLDYNSLDAFEDNTRRHLREGGKIRKVKINYGDASSHNHDYLGFGMKYPDTKKLIIHSIQKTPQQTRLRGGEGKVYPVRIIFLD